MQIIQFNWILFLAITVKNNLESSDKRKRDSCMELDASPGCKTSTDYNTCVVCSKRQRYLYVCTLFFPFCVFKISDCWIVKLCGILFGA